MARYIGTRYADDIYGTDYSDTIEGLGGDDRLYGYGGNDILIGGAGHDELDGGAGADKMQGGTGDDLYVVNRTDDQVIEYAGEGIDVVLTDLGSYTLGANVEDLVALGTANFFGTGNALTNYLYGYLGNDVLDGAGGVDVMFGHKGDDTFYVDEAGDEAVEYAGEGIDLVFTSLAALTLAANIEEMIFDGTGAFSGTGNSLSNYIQGGASNDRLDGGAGHDELDGGAGADLLIGGTGDDLFRIDHAGDRVTEFAGEGNDRIAASVSYALAAGVSVETLGTSDSYGLAAIDLTGNELANIIDGNDGANVLSGGAGSDRLFGLGGNDLLDGGDRKSVV